MEHTAVREGPPHPMVGDVLRELPAMEEPLDVDTLLQTSQPQVRRAPAGLLLVGLAVAVALVVGKDNSNTLWFILNIALLALGGLVVWILARIAKRHRREQELLALVYQNVQFRQWAAAGTDLTMLLSRPMLLPQSRIQALIYLSTVLARCQRFADASKVHDYITEHAQLDPATDQALRAAKVWALLRDDRLVDADRGIIELRRMCGSNRSASLAMAELYRDIKTGHGEEALAEFHSDLPMLRRQLGHRSADAWALAACAARAMGKLDDARSMARNALLLGDAREILSRFPEVEAALRLGADVLSPAGGAA